MTSYEMADYFLKYGCLKNISPIPSYHRLGVDFDVNQVELRKAYKKNSLVCHTDKYMGNKGK